LAEPVTVGDELNPVAEWVVGEEAVCPQDGRIPAHVVARTDETLGYPLEVSHGERRVRLPLRYEVRVHTDVYDARAETKPATAA
jgi:hypothetical protein